MMSKLILTKQPNKTWEKNGTPTFRSSFLTQDSLETNLGKMLKFGIKIEPVR